MPAGTNPDIRPLTTAELDGAFALSSTAGWNQRLDDWRMLLQIAPAGSFAAVDDGQIVGTAIGIDYGTFGWIAMMLVNPAYRGRGLGAQLLEAAMAALPADQPIRLDATPLGRPLYQRYGFADESMLSRRVSIAAERDAERPRGDVRRIAPADLPAIVEQDQDVFAGHRRSVLEWALAGAPGYAWAVRDASGLTSYCFGRTGRLFDQIGPIVAADPDIAVSLVNAAMKHGQDRALVIDAFDAQAPFTAWLDVRGFAVQRPLYRMARAGRAAPLPDDRAPRRPLIEFGIFGPEFG